MGNGDESINASGINGPDSSSNGINGPDSNSDSCNGTNFPDSYSNDTYGTKGPDSNLNDTNGTDSKSNSWFSTFLGYLLFALYVPFIPFHLLLKLTASTWFSIRREINLYRSFGFARRKFGLLKLIVLTCLVAFSGNRIVKVLSSEGVGF